MKSNSYTLKSIGLRRSECDLISSGKAESEGMVQIKYNVESFLPESAPDGERFDLMVSVELVLEGKETETGEIVFKSRSIHYGGFVVDDGIAPDADCEELPSQLAKQIFPVAREHANELLQKMGFRSVYLPWSIERSES